MRNSSLEIIHKSGKYSVNRKICGIHNISCFSMSWSMRFSDHTINQGLRHSFQCESWPALLTTQTTLIPRFSGIHPSHIALHNYFCPYEFGIARRSALISFLVMIRLNFHFAQINNY